MVEPRGATMTQQLHELRVQRGALAGRFPWGLFSRVMTVAADYVSALFGARDLGPSPQSCQPWASIGPSFVAPHKIVATWKATMSLRLIPS